MSAVCCLLPPRRGKEVGMGMNDRKLVAVDTQSLRADNCRRENAR